MNEIRYELWDVISYGPGDPPIPFTKIASEAEFYKVYYKFTEEIKKRPCVIIMSDAAPEIKTCESVDDAGEFCEK